MGLAVCLVVVYSYTKFPLDCITTVIVKLNKFIWLIVCPCMICRICWNNVLTTLLIFSPPTHPEYTGILFLFFTLPDPLVLSYCFPGVSFLMISLPLPPIYLLCLSVCLLVSYWFHTFLFLFILSIYSWYFFPLKHFLYPTYFSLLIASHKLFVPKAPLTPYPFIAAYKVIGVSSLGAHWRHNIGK